MATNPFGGKCYRRGTERRRKAQEGGSGFDEQRTALFVAEGILRCRLSPETFITARRLLGITNVFDENDVDVPAVMFPRDPPRRFAESGIDMDKEAIGGLLSWLHGRTTGPSAPFRPATVEFRFAHQTTCSTTRTFKGVTLGGEKKGVQEYGHL